MPPLDELIVRVRGEYRGDVVAYDGPRLAAPDLARLARPNPVS